MFFKGGEKVFLVEGLVEKILAEMPKVYYNKLLSLLGWEETEATENFSLPNVDFFYIFNKYVGTNL